MPLLTRRDNNFTESLARRRIIAKKQAINNYFSTL